MVTLSDPLLSVVVRRPSCVVRKIELKLRNYWRDFNETWWQCSVPSPDQVLLFFKLIWKTIWPPMQPSWKSITNLNSSSTGGISMKLSGDVKYPIMNKCCYFSNWFEFQYGCHGSHLEKPISNLNSGSAEGISMKFGGSVQYSILTKCCYISSWFEIQYGRQCSHLENLLLY